MINLQPAVMSALGSSNHVGRSYHQRRVKGDQEVPSEIDLCCNLATAASFLPSLRKKAIRAPQIFFYGVVRLLRNTGRA